MALISEIYTAKKAAGRPVISFEFFPPKTEEGERSFFDRTAPALGALGPDFCSVTYGAGGSTRDKTLSIVDRLQRGLGLTALAHLTCVGSTREEIRQFALAARDRGIRNLLALRGDPPAGAAGFVKPEGGFGYASELVTYLKGLGGFCLGVAGFPEGHIESREGREADWERLRAKIECGADFVITQLFFDNQHYLAFRDYLTRRGVRVPLVPGIIPILNAAQIRRFTALCGTELPAELRASLDRVEHDDEAVAQLGIEHATRQASGLLREGAPGLHFYTLNKARSTTQILQNLGLAG